MTIFSNDERGGERAHMTEPAAIRARFDADMAALAAERGGVERWHLIELGWTARQVDTLARDRSVAP